MKNSDMPANPIKLNERIEDSSTGFITINECDDYHAGLTKREHFAGLAMQGLLSYNSERRTAENCAITAMQYADALLKELEKD